MNRQNREYLKENICLGYISQSYLPNGKANGESCQIEVPEKYVIKYNITPTLNTLLKTVSTVKELVFWRTGKKRQFAVKTEEELISIRVDTKVTIEAVKVWVKTWSPPNSQLVTPSKKAIYLDKEITKRQVEYVYFIFNPDSNAIKIGRAKDVEKRLKSLQTANAATLKILGVMVVEARRPPYYENNCFHDEQLIQSQFNYLRINGEWFRAEQELLNYIEENCVKA